jgi:molybdopterin synthase catalytic subunit
MSFITQTPIEFDTLALLTPRSDAGALSTFFGIVRDKNLGRAVLRLHYECYVSMAERRISEIREEAIDRYGLSGVGIVHRVGTLEIGEIAVAVAVSAVHRAEAFEACASIVEAIKHTVPIWKKETFVDGTSAWVACHHAPKEALA